jgi:hypothetical protein
MVVVADPPGDAIARLVEVELTDTAVPVPLRATDCGEPLALSVNVTAPVRAPVAVGIKVTAIMQLNPEATLVPQVFVCAKSPVATIEPIVSAPVPEFLNVMACAGLVVPTVCELKVRVVGDSATAGAAPVAALTVIGVVKEADAAKLPSLV